MARRFKGKLLAVGPATSAACAAARGTCIAAQGSVSGKELCLFAILLGIGTLAVSPVRAEHFFFSTFVEDIRMVKT